MTNGTSSPWRLWHEALVALGAVVIGSGALGLHTGIVRLFAFHYNGIESSPIVVGAGAVGVCARSFRRSDENQITR